MNYNSIQKSVAPNYVSDKKNNLFQSLLVVIYCLVILLIVGNLIGTNALATQGIVLDNLMRQTDKLAKQNQNLSLTIEKNSNLSHIENIATHLGFKRIRSNLIISPVEAVAAVMPK